MTTNDCQMAGLFVFSEQHVSLRALISNANGCFISFYDQATVENKTTARLSTVNITLANCKHIFFNIIVT